LQVLQKKATQPLIRRRLRFLLLLKQNSGMSRAVAGHKLRLLPTGVEEMWELYSKEGIEKYCDYPFKGKKPKLNEEQQHWLKAELKQDCTRSLSEACALVKERTGVQYSVSAMHYVFKSLGIKKKTGRPSHVHQDKAALQAFKKKLSPAK